VIFHQFVDTDSLPMNGNNLDIGTIKYVVFDETVDSCIVTLHTKHAHSGIVYSAPNKLPTQIIV